MSYLEQLRDIINEINIGDNNSQPQSDDTSDEGNENFMDDSTEDTTSDNSSDTSDEGNENFMDDDDSDDDASTESDEGNENFMDDDNSDDNTAPDEGNENFMDDDSDDDASTESDEGNENFMDDNSNDDTQDEEVSDDESGDENFMDGDNEEGGEESQSSDSGEDSDNEESSDNEDTEEYDINKIEDELFSSLTPEQIAIKNHELKNQFIELYSIIGSTLVRINDISKTNENINVLKFITEKLLELREMVDFNVTTAYQTRTYIENNIIYQQCIATLNAIADIIDNIPKLNDTSNNKTDDENENKGELVEKDKESYDSLNLSDSSMSDYQEESTDYNTLF